MIFHDFDKCARDGRFGEQVLDAMYAPEYIVVKATETHDRQQGADRFLIKKDDGRVIKTTDYKTDWRAGQTKRLALEDISMEWPEGHIIRRGWVHTSIASHFVIYVPRFDNAYEIDALALRARWAEIQSACQYRPTGSYRADQQWISRNYCVPLRWLRQQGFFLRIRLAIGIQARFRYPELESS